MDKKNSEKDLISYFRGLGLQVNTSTKARGHNGFFLKNRIDVSRDVQWKIPTLVHEFAHYIHSLIEPDMERTGGTFHALFGTDNPVIKNELVEVTHFVDKNSLCEKLNKHKFMVKEKIKEYEKIIKSDYPKFMRSKKFKEFERYIKKSDAKYLMKYDRVKLIRGFWHKESKIFTIDTIEQDFYDMPKAFAAYIRMHSYQKKQARISARINKSKKYYDRPTELFARFVQGLYTDKEAVERLAPTASGMFFELLRKGHYKNLSEIFKSVI